MEKSFILILFISVISCREREDCHPESILLKLLPDKQISLEQDSSLNRNFYSVEEGEHLVFQYGHSTVECKNIIDDEYVEFLTFEISKGLTAFEYTDEEILQTKCFYDEVGAWVSYSNYQVKEGVIKGMKVSDEAWDIDVNVVLDPLTSGRQPRRIALNGIFKE